jgi:hypothetical protein
VTSARRSTVLLVAGFLLALALTFVFGYRAGRHAHYMRWENEPIRGWMSIPFIAHAHHVPPEMLYSAIGLDPQNKDRRPIRRIAREANRQTEDLIRQLDAAISQIHPHPKPPGSKDH